MFVTAVDFGELISPLLQKLPTLEPDDVSILMNLFVLLTEKV